jgi:hypothetical protein
MCKVMMPQVLVICGLWMGGVLHAQAPESGITGTVLGPGAKPLAGARVLITVMRPSGEGATHVERISDARGRFTAPPFRSGHSAQVLISAPGLGLVGGSLRKGGNAFHLGAGAEVQGIVHDVQADRLRTRRYD